MKDFKGKVIYNPSGKAKEYSYWAANFYVGCSHGCTYCYLKKGRGAKVLGGSSPVLKSSLENETKALLIFQKELDKNKAEIQKYGLFFSFTTDPLLPETIGLTLAAVSYCQSVNVPVKILSKSAHGIHEVINYAKQENWDVSRIAIGATLTGCDELEPNADTNMSRIGALLRCKHQGFRTFASVEPITPGAFHRAFSVIKIAYPVVDLFKIGLQSNANRPYLNSEIQLFFDAVSEYWASNDNNPLIYWKDSFMNMLDFRIKLPDYCVHINNNLFV